MNIVMVRMPRVTGTGRRACEVARLLCIVTLLCVLLGCSKEGGRRAYPSLQDNQPGQASAPASVSSPESIRILDFGPKAVPAGKPFNLQSDGRSAMWFKVDKAIDGQIVVLRFDGHSLRPVVRGSTITAEIPPGWTGSSRQIPITIEIVPTAGGIVVSNEITFQVQ